MGQAEVIKVLELFDEPIPRKKIAEETGDNPIKVSHILKKLMLVGEVKCVEFDRFQSAKALGMDKPFRRCRFYYLS